jgi:4-hydroxybenzoate polyprenyltransferase
MKNTLLIYARALRVNQWIKNFIVFAAILFTGKLFDVIIFTNTVYAFFIFCLLSSTSYLLNDIIDYRYDKKHPMKKYRPIASGLISIPQATFIVFVLTIVALLLSLLYSLNFFFLSVVFLLLHFYYSLDLKHLPKIVLVPLKKIFMGRMTNYE